MAVISSSAGAAGVRNPVVTNETTSATPDTETSFALTAPKSIRVTNRGKVAVKYAFASGASGTIYASLYPHESYRQDGISAASVTFYVQAERASQRLEVITWY